MNKYLTAIFYGAILFLLYKMFQKFGFIPDKASNKIGQAEGSKIDKKGNETNALNPSYVTDLINSTKRRVKLLPQAEAAKLAQQIYDSKHWYGDKDSQTILVFKSIKYKSQVSQVAQKFAQMFGQDMATYLDFLDKNNFALVFDTVNQKTSGIQ